LTRGKGKLAGATAGAGGSSGWGSEPEWNSEGVRKKHVSTDAFIGKTAPGFFRRGEFFRSSSLSKLVGREGGLKRRPREGTGGEKKGGGRMK